MAFNFLSSPISTTSTSASTTTSRASASSSSTSSSPRIGPESTIQRDRDEDTAITSPTIRSHPRNVKSEVDVDVGVGAEVGVDDERGLEEEREQELELEQEEQEEEEEQLEEQERTVVTNTPRGEPEAEHVHETASPLSRAYTVNNLAYVQPAPSLFATETTRRRRSISSGSPTSSSSGSSGSSSSSNGSSVSSTRRRSSNAGVKRIHVISTSWPLVNVVDDSVLSSPPTSSEGSTITTTRTTHPQQKTRKQKRYTADEKGKGKAPDYSGRLAWVERLDENEKEYRGGGGGDEETEKERSRTRTRTRIESSGEQKTTGMKSSMKSSMKKKPRSRTNRPTRDDSRYRKHKTIQEDGLSRDFVLLIALCIGFACAGILVVRPAFLAVRGSGVGGGGGGGGGGFELWDE